MATENPGSTSGLFGGVMGSGRGARPRAEYPTESAGHTAVPGADGNFLGNVHQGRGVDPEAHAEIVAADAGTSPAVSPVPDAAGSSGPAPVEIPHGGLPVTLPLVPSLPGASIAVQVAGLPENTALSSGHALPSGGWQLDLADTPGLRLVPAAGAGDNTLAGPLSLDVSYVVTNDTTGESRVVQLGPVSALADADTAANTVSESAADGDSVGINAAASDPDAYDRVIYTLLDDAGGRFAIDPLTGEVTVADASLLDYETATSHTITVQAASTDGSTQTQSFTIALTDDTSEFAVTPVADADTAADGVSESASNGDTVGITAFAGDGDATDTVTYSLTDDAGGRFAIDASTGVVTVADASLLDYETATSHTITVQATSSDGSTQTQSFTIALSDDTSEFSVTPVTDADAAADSVSESASDGDVVGVTAFASDGDATDTVTYSLTDDAGGRFAIDATTGVVTVADASLLDYEIAASHTITVQATSTDGSTQTQTFTIGLADDTSEFTVSAVADTDAAADGISEGASNGDTVGITAFASDADGSDTVTYSLTDNAGGRFAIDATTGVVTAADASLLDYETATSHTIVVQATSTDGSTQAQSFTIALSDDTSEFAVSEVSDGDTALNAVSENASNGDIVGVTAFASDGDATDSVTYSLTDDAGGRFAIDATTGQVTVADGSLLDYETAASHSITVQATSSDGSIANQTFSIAVTDVNEAPTGGSVKGPSPAAGAALHFDATDIDADGGTSANPGNGSAVSRWDDSSGGNHDAVQQSAAPVVASGAINGKDAIDFSGANAALHVGDTSAINLSTVDERSYAIAFQTGDDVSGFQVVYEEGGTVRGYSLSIAADPANGGQPTLWAFVWNTAEWGSGNQYKAINLGPVAANETYSVVMVHDATAANLADRTFSAYVNGDYAGSVGSVDVQYAHSGDIGVGGYLNDTLQPVTHGSLSGNGGEFAGKVGEVLIWNAALDTQQVSETSSYLNEKWGGAPSVGEDAPNGTAVFAVADIVDPDGSDTYTYSLVDDAGGRFAVDASTGVVSIADAPLIDYETAQSHAVTVRVTDAGGNTLEIPVTIDVGDGNDVLGAVSDTDAAADGVSESASNGDVVGITAFANDADGADTVTYSLADDAGGRFAIDATTGVVTVADASQLDYETATSHTITVQAESSDGSTETKLFTVALSDDTGEFSVSPVSDTDASPNSVSEGASNGDLVGVTAFASDADASDTITYSLADDAGGRFAIDATTGQVTVADASLLDYETATSHTITVQATSSDGSTQTQSFTIALSDDTGEFSVSAVSDTDAAANTVSEGASNGDVVGITAFASDADASDTVTYSLTDDAGGRFAIDATTGQVTVADASLLDYETATSHTITVEATSSDGSTQTQSFTIALSDDTSEFTVSAVSDADASANTVSESASNGDVVGVTALASDADGTDSVTYSLTDDAGGRFAINAATGVVTVVDASLLDYETATSHTVTVQATSTDGSTSTQAFTIDVANVVEAATVTTSDSTGNEDSAIPLGIQLSDLDGGTTNTITISGVPSGATLSAGTDIGGGSWTLTPAQVSGLTVTPPADSDADFQLSVTVTSEDGAQTVITSAQTIDVTVDAVADAPILTVADGPTQLIESTFESGMSGSGFVDGSLDGWSPGAGNQIELWSENDVPGNAYEGHEFIELNYEGSGTYPDAGIIERTISTTADATYDLTFEVSPRPGFESYMDFKVSAVDVSSGNVLETVTVNWDGSTVSSLTWQEHSLQFTGTGGDVQLVFEDIGAVHDYGRGAYIDDIQLSETINYTSGDAVDMSPLISVGLSDSDGSETLGTVEIANIPTGAVMAVDGMPLDAVNGAVSVTTAQLPGLTFTAPEGFSGDLTFDITATSTETSNGDSASTTDSLTLSFKSDDENLDDRGSSSNSHLNGNGSDNTLYGGAGDDTINGRSGDDLLYGGSGDDTLSGSKGNDALLAGDGNDTLHGGSGDDFLYGGSGDDRLYGDSGNDTLYGGDGNDQLDGGSGDDRISGGLGNDTATGGDGNDIYIYGGGDDSFAGGGGAWTDTIQLSGVDGVDAYNGWTVSSDVTVTSSGDGYIELAADSDGTITMDDGSQLTFTDVDRIEW